MLYVLCNVTWSCFSRLRLIAANHTKANITRHTHTPRHAFTISLLLSRSIYMHFIANTIYHSFGLWNEFPFEETMPLHFGLWYMTIYHNITITHNCVCRTGTTQSQVSDIKHCHIVKTVRLVLWIEKSVCMLCVVCLHSSNSFKSNSQSRSESTTCNLRQTESIYLARNAFEFWIELK